MRVCFVRGSNADLAVNWDEYDFQAPPSIGLRHKPSGISSVLCSARVSSRKPAVLLAKHSIISASVTPCFFASFSATFDEICISNAAPLSDLREFQLYIQKLHGATSAWKLAGNMKRGILETYDPQQLIAVSQRDPGDNYPDR